MKEYNDYLAQLKEDKSVHTIRSYKSAIDGFLYYFGIETLEDFSKINTTSIDEYRSHLKESGLISSSINSRLRPISAFLSWCVEREYLDKLPKVKFLKQPKNLPVFLTFQETEMIMNACEDLQEKIFIGLLLATGMRRNELVNVKISDISDGEILIHGKGDKQRRLPINQKVLDLINEYLKTHDNEYLFVSKRGNHKISGDAVYLRLKKIAERAGISPERIEKITPHKIRHTFCTNLVANGISLPVIKEAVGHESIATTSKYAHVHPETLKNALNGIYVGGL